MKKLSFLLPLLLLSGCSVYQAASNEGVNVADARACKSRSGFLALGLKLISRHPTKDGKVVEVYQGKIRKSDMTYARALGYGVLDLMTLGLWEVVGTPVEGALSDTGLLTIEATFPSAYADQAESVRVLR